MMKGRDLLDHPGQWKLHGKAQAQGVAGVLREVGQVGVLRAWRSKRAGGAVVTWDGHLRKSLDPDLEWPVDIYTDLTDEEADLLLAVIDPVAAMAEVDAGAINALFESLRPADGAVAELLAEIEHKAGAVLLDEAPAPDPLDILNEIGRKAGEQVSAENGTITCPECGAIIPLERNL